MRIVMGTEGPHIAARAIGDRSAAWARRASLSSATVVAAAKASNASATMASTWSALSGDTWAGS